MKRDNKGRFTKSAKWVTKICKYCNSEFDIRKSQLKYGRGKYCSRKCNDLHKKETYKGKNNPMYGEELSEERKKQNSEIMKKLWASGSHYEKYKKGVDRFVKENGYFPGTDDNSIEKRKQTMLDKYGVEHNWVGIYGERLCDNTFEDKYGMTSLEYMNKKCREINSTSIENEVEYILKDNDIVYEKEFYLYFGENSYRIYDFLITDYNILLEIDGDYWHANPEFYNEVKLNDIQKSNLENDKFKDRLAIENDYSIIRFYGNDVRKKNFTKMLLDSIYEKV